MNVLIVEDNNSSRKLISAHIEEMGHFVIAANNGSEALTKYHDNYIDLVLMDVEMPGIYPCHLKIRDFRVSVGIQVKASLAGNDVSFTRAITKDWISTESPEGQGYKRPSSLL